MKIAIDGGSFNPPCNHHLQIVIRIIYRFNKIIIYPCGQRQDKPSVNILSEKHRMYLVGIAFGGIPKVEINSADLEFKIYTPTYSLQKLYERRFPDAEIWHIVGGDIVVGGRNQESEIHRTWYKGEEVWRTLNFTVIARPGYELDPKDMPPHSELIEIEGIYGSGTMVRERIANGEPIDDLVPQNIAKYIQENSLYSKQ